MKALVKYALGPGNMEIRDIPEPAPGPGQVLIEVKEAGICGSDIHIYHSDIAIPLNPPVVTGHEFSGVVVSVNSVNKGDNKGNKDKTGEDCDLSASSISPSLISPGDRVVSETAFHYCGVCDFCREGFYNLCVERRTLGYWFNGVFTRYVVVPEARVRLIPEGVDFTSAAMTEPLACVVHAVYDLTRIVPGDVVLVSGPGAVGIMAAQVAKIHGATVVLSGTDIDADRLKSAESLGIHHTVNIQKENLNEFLLSLTGGYGADVVLECSGSSRGIDAGLNAIKKRGWFTQIGLPGKKIEFDIEKVCYKELHFSGSLGSRNASWRKALQLLGEGKIELKPLATDKFSILEWKRAFEKFEKKEGGKIFLLPAPD